MFSNSRKGSQLYILHKNTLYVEVGTVETISNIPMLGYYPNMPSFPIDVVVKVGEKVTTYQQLPSSAEYAEVTERTSGEQVFIACTRDAVNTELANMRQQSVDSLNSVPYHEQRIKDIDKLVGQLNPEVLEKQAQLEEISRLKEQMESMTQDMTALREQNKELIEQIKSERASTKRKEQ